jgi:hypothetical protein
MAVKTLPLSILLVMLTGCATCERHPVACWAGGVVLVGSIAASTNHRTASPSLAIGDPSRPPCTKQPDGSCR